MIRYLILALLTLTLANRLHAAPYQYEKRRVVYKNLHANLYVPLGVTKPAVVIGFGGSDGRPLK